MAQLTYENVITVLTTFCKQISCKSLMKNLVAGASNTQISQFRAQYRKELI